MGQHYQVVVAFVINEKVDQNCFSVFAFWLQVKLFIHNALMQLFFKPAASSYHVKKN